MQRTQTRSFEVDLSPIHTMFEKAQASGLKKLAYRAEGLVLSLAKPTSTNPGAIYVKRRDGTYLGKVKDRKFVSFFGVAPADRDALYVIAANPAEAATRYGRMTGECSCCGRELSDPSSVEAGIGPVCATKWGL